MGRFVKYYISYLTGKFEFSYVQCFLLWANIMVFLNLKCGDF